MAESAGRRASNVPGRPRLLVNATELLRQPGTSRTIESSIDLVTLGAEDPRLSGDVDIAVELVSTLNDIEVAGTLHVSWADHCARCLRPVAATLAIDVDERYAEPTHDPGMPDDPEAFPIANGQLDLAAMVREEVLLAIPDAPLCRDDCPGLCPVCGTDLVTSSCACDPLVRDDRWAVLDQLLDET